MNEIEDSIALFMQGWRRERPDLDPWPLGIIGRVPRIYAHVQRRAETWLRPLGLTWETFSVIVALRRSGAPFELNPTDLQRESLLTSGAMTNRIDRVEALGLVERRADPVDRRGIRVKLTAKGKSLADKAIAAHFRATAELLGGISQREARELDALLAKLLRSLERSNHGSAGTLTQPGASPASRAGRKATRSTTGR